MVGLPLGFADVGLLHPMGGAFQFFLRRREFPVHALRFLGLPVDLFHDLRARFLNFDRRRGLHEKPPLEYAEFHPVDEFQRGAGLLCQPDIVRPLVVFLADRRCPPDRARRGWRSSVPSAALLLMAARLFGYRCAACPVRPSVAAVVGLERRRGRRFPVGAAMCGVAGFQAGRARRNSAAALAVRRCAVGIRLFPH